MTQVRFYSTQPLVNKDCGICLGPLDKNVVAHWDSLEWIHAFHSDCIENWFRFSNTCPTCRAEVEQSLENKFIRCIKAHLNPLGFFQALCICHIFLLIYAVSPLNHS